MKKENLEKLLRTNLQLFADGDDNNSSGGDNGGDNGNNGSADHDADAKHGEKTFTQSEVSGMMAKEKNEGKRSVLKALGFKSEDEAKEAIEKYNKYLEDQKSDADKQKEALDKANNEKSEAEKRAIAAENKVACYNSGINPEYIDDVLAIASNKVSDDKDLETVLKEMKEDKKYESFFGKTSSGSNHGTGSNAGHSGNNEDDKNDLGKRLAEQRKNSMSAINKSNYFND
jgi:hypothetical protein